ncbi:MAG: PKD domain-containing protein [Cyclobacteriaceae bacterium]
MKHEKKLYLVIAFLLVQVSSHHVYAQDVGVIRWDAWNGDGSGVGIELEESLGPNQWHDKLPYFAAIDGPNEVTIKFEQSDMDSDLQMANQAGIDYFVFVWYASGALAESVDFYKNSPNKSMLDYAYVVEGQRWNDALILDLITNHFPDPNYKKVLGGRPIVYLLRDGDDGGIECEMQTLMDQANAAGFNPYLVGMSARPFNGGYLHARSDYFVGQGNNGNPFSELVTTAENRWDQKVTEYGIDVVPLVTTGYDPRSRNNANNPTTWGGFIESTKYAATAQPQEIADHLANAFTWIAQNPSDAPANQILMYAWNEFDEGGWLCPTLADGDARLEAIENVINNNTSGNDITVNISYPTSIADVTLPAAGPGGLLLNSSFEQGVELKSGAPEWSANWPEPWANVIQLQKVRKTFTYAGNQALKVFNRGSGKDSPIQDITRVLQINGPGSYDVEVMARRYSGNDDVKIVVNINDDNGNNSFETSFTNVTDTYTLVSGTLNISWSGTLKNATIGIESTTNELLYLDDFYMDLTGGGGLVTTLFEAEDAMFYGDTSVVTLSGASNNEVVSIASAQPSGVEWTIGNVPTAGNYDVAFGTRSRNGNTGNGQRRASITSSAGPSPVIHFFQPSATVIEETVSLYLGAGTNTIELDITYGYIDIDYMEILLTSEENVIPTADAGADLIVEDTDGSGGEMVILNGSGSSDTDGEIVSYVWTRGNNVIGTGVTPSVLIPTGNHRIILTVTDESGTISRDDMKVIVAKTSYEEEGLSLFKNVSIKPLSGARGDSVIHLKAPPASFTWTIPDVPETGNYQVVFGTRSHNGNTDISPREVTISSCPGSTVTYDFPPSATIREDTVTLSLTEGTNLITFNPTWGWMEVDYITLLEIGGSNEAPNANAGPDQNVTVIESVMLDASASTDDGTIASYIWTENGAEIANSVSSTVELAGGIHEIVLTVTDNDGVSSQDTVTITVSTLITLEAEEAEFIMGTIVKEEVLGASNDSVATMLTAGSKLVWTIDNVPTAASYEITFGTRSRNGQTGVYGNRKATISSTANTTEVVFFFPPSATVRTDAIMLDLDPGTNTIELEDNWANMQVDYMSIDLAGCGSCRTTTSSAIDQDIEIDQDITLYPNPSTGIVHLQGLSGKVEVYDIMGKKILETMAVEGQNTIINLSGHSGINILKAGASTRKLIIQD